MVDFFRRFRFLFGRVKQKYYYFPLCFMARSFYLAFVPGDRLLPPFWKLHTFGSEATELMTSLLSNLLPKSWSARWQIPQDRFDVSADSLHVVNRHVLARYFG